MTHPQNESPTASPARGDGLNDRPKDAVAPRIAVDELPALHPGDPKTPVWRRLDAAIRQKVQSGAWSHGDRLPTEAELAEHFGVNRHTLRRAIGALVDDRVLSTARGRGTFVAGAPPIAFRPSANASEVDGFADGPIAERFLGHEIVEAGARLGGLLALQANAALHALDVRLEKGTVPLAFARYWFPVAQFDRLATVYRAHGSIAATLAQFGHLTLSRREVVVSACLPDEAQARQLDMPPQMPVITVCSVGCGKDGVPLYVCELRLPPDRTAVFWDSPDETPD